MRTRNARSTFLQPHTLWRHLKVGLAQCKLPEITWYQTSRHTFASQWVLAGGSIMRLSKIMGHSSVEVTERYAHLLPDSFRESEFSMLKTDLAGDPEVVHMSPENGAGSYVAVTLPDAAPSKAV